MTAPPPHGHFASVDPGELQPARGWYWVAGAIMAIGVCAGAALAVLSVGSILSNLPELATEFESGDTTTVELTADTDWAIYVDNTDEGDTGGGQCTGQALQSGDMDMSAPSGTFTFSQDQRSWELIQEVSVSSDGEYQISCTSNGPATFAVGESVDTGGFVGQTFGALAIGFGIPCLALVIGGVMMLVVGIRRSNHKKRLLAARFYGGA